MYTIQELNRFPRLQIFKKGIGIGNLLVVEAWLALPYCCYAPPAVPLEFASIPHYLFTSIPCYNDNNDNVDSLFTIASFPFVFPIHPLRLWFIIKS